MANAAAVHGRAIVNTASVQGLAGMAAEGAAHGIRADSISPGTVATPAHAQMFADEQALSAVLAPTSPARTSTAA